MCTERNEGHLKNLKAQPIASVERANVKRELLKITRKRVTIAKEYTVCINLLYPKSNAHDLPFPFEGVGAFCNIRAREGDKSWPRLLTSWYQQNGITGAVQSKG